MPGLPSNISAAARWAIPLVRISLVGTALFGGLLMLDIWRGLGRPVHDVPPILLTLAIEGGRDPVAGLVMGLQGAAALACALWLFRASKNAAALSPAPGRRVRPWMQLTWFVIPVIDLVMPYRGIRQIWASSVLRGPITARMPVWSMLWWGAWLASTYLPWFAPWDDLPFATNDTRLADSALELMAIPFYLIAGLFFLHIIRQVTRGQLVQAAERGWALKPQPAPQVTATPHASSVWDGVTDRS